MELYDAIFSARNTHKFKSKTIPYSKLFAIIEAGYAANAIGNVPSAKIVIVETESIRNKISAISKSKKTINAAITFVDIAGLVKGASKGEGLGNKFLSHVREVDTIIHLTRCFDSEKIQNV